MSSKLLHPPAHLPPATALQLSQQAPYLLRTIPSAISSYSLSSLWSTAETPDLWTTYENLMLSCLRTGDEESSHLCLQRLQERFGDGNERVMALRGLFQEAIAQDDAALKQILEEYDSILAKDPGNMVSKNKQPRALLIFPAYIKAAYRSPSVSQQGYRGYHRTQSASRVLSYRCRGLGRVGGSIHISGYVPTGNIRFGRSSIGYAECMERQLLTRP